MNVLETILSFLTTLARIIFPRRKRPVAGDDLCPCPLPEPSIPPLPVERGNGSNPRRSRSDSLPPLSPPPAVPPPGGAWGGVSGGPRGGGGGVGGSGVFIRYWRDKSSSVKSICLRSHKHHLWPQRWCLVLSHPRYATHLTGSVPHICLRADKA